MHKLNNKGYMLVEIILASVLAFGVAYFIINLTIKLKNKNDDLFVDTEVVTDKSIITNKLMAYIMDEKETFDCSKLTRDNNTVKYNGNSIDTVNDNTDIGMIVCINDTTNGEINVAIPMEIKQMPDNDYDVRINYYYKINDVTPPTCSLEVNDANNLVFKTKEDNIGVTGYGLVAGTTKEYNNKDSIPLAGYPNGTDFTGFVKDAAGNEGYCIYKKTTAPYCTLSADIWHYGVDLVNFYNDVTIYDSYTLSASDSSVVIYETDANHQYAASLAQIGYSPVTYTATVKKGDETATCSISMVKKNAVTYTRTATPCLYDKYYCYREADYYSLDPKPSYTVDGWFCSPQGGGGYCPEVTINGHPGCCKSGVSYGECYGWILRDDYMQYTNIAFQHAYDYVTTVTSCTPNNFTCDKTHLENWKVECSGPSGQACPNGYTEFGNYCYKY